MTRAKLVVVDDDAAIRDILEMVLSSEGYEVLTAADGFAALEAVRRSPPDLILLDIKMPVMSGSEFAKAYREAPGPHAPIVVLTAAQDAQGRATELGAEAYLPKPFELEDLLELIARHTRTAP